MRKLIAIAIVFSFLAACSNSGTGKPEAEKKADTAKPAKDNKKSIPSEANATVGNTSIRINYHSPAVRGRVIWGGLVPYGAVWVTGAHSATRMEVGKDFRMGDKTVPAGKYALFSIPGKDEWTIILNRNWDQHLADDYSEADDVARVKVKPELRNQNTERLNYTIEPAGGQKANIVINWEKLSVRFPVEVL